ncbi:MAG TPA: phosphomannomutase/phosphoglucomutase [Polyangiaceae bacterium]|nr:phosphomannomutase/phosphoglucomutase [Polyangiaceae bacterium]
MLRFAPKGMTQHIFREYDIRGVAERDLTSDVVERIGRGIAELLGKNVGRAPRIAVGRDCRLSGPRIHAALTQGLQKGGAQLLDVGVGPTPALYFGVHHLETDGGVMITGSHNPAPDNGFKIMIGHGSFFGAAIQELRGLVEGPALPDKPGGSLTAAPIDDAYVQKLSQGVKVGRKLKVVVDGGNGAAGPLGLKTLAAVGVVPTALYCDMDGRFPNHHPDPTVPENLSDLIARVRAEKADLGVAWDGDGDRLGVVDEKGDIIWGDRLLALFAGPIIAAQPGATIIGDVKCSQTLFDHVEKLGGRPIMWKTGHSLIKTKMKEEKAAVAGEMSGHFFFADRYFGYDDAIYAALRMIELLSGQARPLSELLEALPTRHFTPELRKDCPDAKKFAVIESLRQELKDRGNVNQLDGVRVTYDDGAWALVRASNTGPVLVLRFEAPSAERLAEIRTDVERVVDQVKQRVGAA